MFIFDMKMLNKTGCYESKGLRSCLVWFWYSDFGQTQMWLAVATWESYNIVINAKKKKKKKTKESCGENYWKLKAAA